ncbi:unnamed protein product [Lathyrus sativus]|nr:unnamed protein product [Lathyrus sativus]
MSLSFYFTEKGKTKPLSLRSKTPQNPFSLINFSPPSFRQLCFSSSFRLRTQHQYIKSKPLILLAVEIFLQVLPSRFSQSKINQIVCYYPSNKRCTSWNW